MYIYFAEVFQAEGKHDVAELHFKGSIDRHSTNLVRAGDPVKFTWSVDHRSTVFVGFVHTVEKNNTVDNVFTKITCINNSHILKSTTKKVYKNLTADRIVREIAQRNNMAADVATHPLVINNMVQAGQSDLQFLQHLAHKTGYVIRVSNTNIEFKPREQFIYEHLKKAPSFHHFDLAPSSLRPQQTLLSFTAQDSVPTPEHGSQGDVGLAIHDQDGNNYRFNKGHNLDQGSPSSIPLNIPINWKATYGQV
jgi:hypothetical protein